MLGGDNTPILFKQLKVNIMPTYDFHNKETNEYFTEFMSIAEHDEYLKNNPHVQTAFLQAPLLHSGRGMGKPDSGFRDLLKNIKKSNIRSNINTF